MEHDLQSILRAIPLFKTLTPQENAALAELMTMQGFKRGESLLAENHPPAGLYVLLDGKVSVMKAKGQTADHICDLDAGECVGELEIVEGSPCSASVVAETDVQAAVISKQNLESFFATSPVAASKVLRQMVGVLAARLRQSNVSYTSLMTIVDGMGEE